MGASEVTVTLVLSAETETTSPRAPALPPTLMRSARKVSKEEMSMILSSTCRSTNEGDGSGGSQRWVRASGFDRIRVLRMARGERVAGGERTRDATECRRISVPAAHPRAVREPETGRKATGVIQSPGFRPGRRPSSPAFRFSGLGAGVGCVFGNAPAWRSRRRRRWPSWPWWGEPLCECL